ncbi:hypothetical protein BZB76_4228 [Actinomadura pelletieri DSM 43383]|uniref:Uncharacterized protein n=1 Tax=Actinomadura pelletieri DSM 43383 TaxID=1120940 RepID=A0A495QLY7_9ACTN|nr:hypothetical protein [Actinomadura pelletieri]RKS73533.1 hypothetical protein BZB76_4228 [Actinomadura pelletieri DSM 43383]
MTSKWRLPRGATGFWSEKSDALPQTDSRGFATYCHEAARRSGGRVLTITPPGVTPNFYTAVILRGDGRLALLGHLQLPVTAIAEVPAAGECSLNFVEDEALRNATMSMDTFRLLTVDELETPVSSVDLSSLDSAEHSQIAYWMPETVGELFFNYWD